MNVLDTTDADGLHESHLEEDAWRNAVLDEVTEPVLMAYDYKGLLAKASGRIVILSNFADSRCCSLFYDSVFLTDLIQALLSHCYLWRVAMRPLRTWPTC